MPRSKSLFVFASASHYRRHANHLSLKSVPLLKLLQPAWEVTLDGNWLRIWIKQCRTNRLSAKGSRGRTGFVLCLLVLQPLPLCAVSAV